MPVFDEEYIKIKIRTHGNKVYTDFHGLGMTVDWAEYDFILMISIDSLFFYEKKHYLQIYLDGHPYKIVAKEMTSYLDYNLIGSDENHCFCIFWKILLQV